MSSRKDAALSWGGDLELGAGGDIAVVENGEMTQQRVLRRLLTNPGDYIWFPDYGAGLGRLIGAPVDLRLTEALVKQQLKSEHAVSQSPAPVVTLAHDNSGRSGLFSLSIEYREKWTSATRSVLLNLGT